MKKQLLTRDVTSYSCRVSDSASYTTCWLFQVSRGGGGGGEAQAAGPGGDRAAACYTQPHHHYHHQTMPLPLASLSPAACSVLDASAAQLPLSSCQPCHTHCTCWHKVREQHRQSLFGCVSVHVHF